MKITKRQLKRIIKEEIHRLNEIDPRSFTAWNRQEEDEEVRAAAATSGRYGSKRPGRRISSETSEDVFIEALRDTWNSVRIDVDIPDPTWEDKTDEASAMLSTYHPEVAKEFDALPSREQDMLLRLAFYETTGFK